MSAWKDESLLERRHGQLLFAWSSFASLIISS